MIRKLVWDFVLRLIGLAPNPAPNCPPCDSAEVDDTPEETYPMITTVYRVTVTTADGRACLELEKDKQTFVPRDDDTLHVTDLVQRSDSEVEADVVEVVYDPIEEVATVYAATDLDISKGYKIDDIVEAAQEDGWTVYGDVEYFGDQPCGKCPGNSGGQPSTVEVPDDDEDFDDGK